MSTTVKKPREPEQLGFLWKALRRLRRATAIDLAMVTERPKNAVQRDLRLLVATGFVRVEGKRLTTVHVMARDEGPKPPMFIFDPKSRELRGAVDRNTRKAWGLNGKEVPPDELGVHRRANWMPKVECRKPTRPARRKHRDQRKVIAPYQQRLNEREAAVKKGATE